MNITSKLASEPVRPEIPINGLSLDDWVRANMFTLLDWFHTSHGKEAQPCTKPEEWDSYCALQYGYQQCRDEELGQ